MMMASGLLQFLHIGGSPELFGGNEPFISGGKMFQYSFAGIEHFNLVVQSSRSPDPPAQNSRTRGQSDVT